MIEINFVPLQARKKRRGSQLIGKFNLPLEIVFGLGGGLLILLVITHFLLLGFNIVQLGKYKQLQKETEALKPTKEKTDVIINEFRQLQTNFKGMEDLVGRHDVLWAQKLNILSEILPRGVWLKKISFNGDVLFIEGSAISEKKKEMINVHTLVGNLKKENDFLIHLSDLELESIQRRRLNKSEIVDFLITAKFQ